MHEAETRSLRRRSTSVIDFAPFFHDWIEISDIYRLSRRRVNNETTLHVIITKGQRNPIDVCQRVHASQQY